MENTIIVTGASKSIGKYLFDLYSSKGYRVFGTRNSTPTDPDDRIARVDISDYDSVASWIDSIAGSLRNVVLVNCAGTTYSAFAHKADIDQWHRVIRVNVLGTFNVIRCLLPLMREQGYGRIVNFSSVVARTPTPGVSAYAASKAALWGMSKSLAVENASKGITVNSINLGYANIGMGVNDVPEAYQQTVKSRIPTARFCEPYEIFTTVQYLVETEYVNGTSIDLSGALV